MMMTDLAREALHENGVGKRGLKAQPAMVTATTLAKHLDLSRQHVTRLADDGVLERVDGGFDLDKARTAYIRHLRDHRRSSRSEADNAFTNAKAELVRLRIRERAGKLMEVSEAIETIEEMASAFRTDCRAWAGAARGISYSAHHR
jgi:hypothetical protein